MNEHAVVYPIHQTHEGWVIYYPPDPQGSGGRLYLDISTQGSRPCCLVFHDLLDWSWSGYVDVDIDVLDNHRVPFYRKLFGPPKHRHLAGWYDGVDGGVCLSQWCKDGPATSVNVYREIARFNGCKVRIEISVSKS